MQEKEWRFCPRCASPLVRRERDGRVRPICEACDFVYFADPKVTVGVLVERAGQLLLGRRAVDPQMGLWCLPGGFVEYGEPVREAAAREVLEESGLEVAIGALLGVWDFGDDGLGDKKGVVLFFRGHVTGGELVAGDDMAELGWFAPGGWPDLAFESNSAVLQMWAAGPHSG